MISRRFLTASHPHHRHCVLPARRLPRPRRRCRRPRRVRREARRHSRRSPQPSSARRAARRRPAAGTSGSAAADAAGARRRPALPARRMVAEIKQELQSEMGLLPVQLLRDRRSSFVELYSYDNLGKTNYGTAGYLGRRLLHHRQARRRRAARTRTTATSSGKIISIKVMYDGKEMPAKLIDAGDADVEVHSGDWAIIQTRDLDLPALHVDTAFALRLRRSDLPPRQRLLEGDHPLDRLRRPADGERPRDLPDRRPSRRVGRRRARSSAATSSASRSAGCRATTASRSSCRSARRCCASCRVCTSPLARLRQREFRQWQRASCPSQPPIEAGLIWPS